MLTRRIIACLDVRDGRVVNLCWKHGEKKVEWWHGMDEGYASRKAL